MHRGGNVISDSDDRVVKLVVGELQCLHIGRGGGGQDAA